MTELTWPQALYGGARDAVRRARRWERDADLYGADWRLRCAVRAMEARHQAFEYLQSRRRFLAFRAAETAETIERIAA